MRIGIGKDIHKLIPGSGFYLGGVFIPCEYQCLADSDGDVVFHSLSDAILSAIHKGDIGDYFTKDNVPVGMDSSIIVKKALSMMDSSMLIENVSIIVTLERPKVSSFREQIELRIAEILQIKPTQVSISFGTNEGLGDIGSGKAVLAETAILVK